MQLSRVQIFQIFLILKLFMKKIFPREDLRKKTNDEKANALFPNRNFTYMMRKEHLCIITIEELNLQIS